MWTLEEDWVGVLFLVLPGCLARNCALGPAFPDHWDGKGIHLALNCVKLLTLRHHMIFSRYVPWNKSPSAG